MQIVFKGKNIEVTDALRKHAEQKLAKLDRYGIPFKEIEVKFGIEKNPSIQESQTVELTLVGNGPMMRAKDSDRDMYVAVDKAVAKLQRQIQKYHRKRIDRTHGHKTAHKVAPSEEQPSEPGIVKTKAITLKPMTPEEAALQMDLLGHDFFVFTNAETEQANVVYRRNDGNFGLIDTSE